MHKFGSLGLLLSDCQIVNVSIRVSWVLLLLTPVTPLVRAVTASQQTHCIHFIYERDLESLN